MTPPLFSVIVPLEYHRGQWEQCLLGWQAQTAPKSQYETILVVPSDFPEQEKLRALLGPRDRLEYSTEQHDISLCGAARANGQFVLYRITLLARAGRSGKMPASIHNASRIGRVLMPIHTHRAQSALDRRSRHV
jgi:hypothetical protein